MGTHTTPATEVVRELLAEADPTADHYLLDPSPRTIDGLVAASETVDELPLIRILARREVLYGLRHNFPLASRLEDLTTDGSVSIRETPVENSTSVLVSPTTLSILLQVEDVTRSLDGDDPDAISSLFSESEELWDSGEAYSLRTPPLTTALDGATERLGESFARQFEAAVEWAETLSDPSTFSAVRAAVAIGAAEEQLHYDVSKWGEDTGVASKASFSRHKGDLEELGIVRTEKVSVPMGRPRQRLFLTEEYRERFEEDGLEVLLADATTE